MKHRFLIGGAVIREKSEGTVGWKISGIRRLMKKVTSADTSAVATNREEF